jgi:hypothetical protein
MMQSIVPQNSITPNLNNSPDGVPVLRNCGNWVRSSCIFGLRMTR